VITYSLPSIPDVIDIPDARVYDQFAFHAAPHPFDVIVHSLPSIPDVIDTSDARVYDQFAFHAAPHPINVIIYSLPSIPDVTDISPTRASTINLRFTRSATSVHLSVSVR
jgi:hypothetical protein